MDQDLYAVLGVKKTANESEIRKAFLKAAKKYHPDVNPNDKVAEQKFKEVNLAYEVLKDPKKRQQYDQMRSLGQNPFAQRPPRGAGPSWGGGPGMGSQDLGDFGLGDLFEEIFSSGGFGTRTGGRRRGAGGRPFGEAQSPAQRGQDREAKLSLSFEDAAHGGEKSIELEGGKRFKVKIPEGIDSGTKIKLAGQGDKGTLGAPAGDLILTVEVLPHPYFTREKNDIILKLPITFSESVLGGEIEIPTLSGLVHLKIPKGVSSGQRLKLAGKGIRSLKQGTRGDQFVEVLIKVPKDPSPAYLEAAQKLVSESFHPRSHWPNA